MAAPLQREAVHVTALPTRLKQLSAQYFPDRSSGHAHIYYSAPMRHWLKVYRTGPAAVAIEHYVDCPCSG